MILTAVVQITVDILALIFVTKDYDMDPIVGVTWNPVDLFLLLMILTLYVYFSGKLLIQMYSRHRLEFRKHACKQIANLVTTSLCIVIFLYQDFVWLLNYSCELSKAP